MRAACRTFCPLTALRRTRLDTLPFPRNEGVPGSSPGVGFALVASLRASPPRQRVVCQALCQVGGEAKQARRHYARLFDRSDVEARVRAAQASLGAALEKDSGGDF